MHFKTSGDLVNINGSHQTHTELDSGCKIWFLWCQCDQKQVCQGALNAHDSQKQVVVNLTFHEKLISTSLTKGNSPWPKEKENFWRHWH